MKKILIILMTALICTGITAYAADIPVYINDEKLAFDVQPQLINDRVMVPMRFIFEKLGATVSYEEETRTIMSGYTNASGKASIIILLIDNPKAFVNSTAVELESPPVELDGRTLVPLRFISEALGFNVLWNEPEQAVYITTAE